jgi:heme-degrading monooxygenase HmoA
MIARLWHGWTTPANADTYETLLKTEIFPGIAARQIAGYHGIQLLRQAAGDEVEFITLMWFESLDAIRAFAGEDYAVAVVLPQAHALLSRYDTHSQHYEVKADLRV